MSDRKQSVTIRTIYHSDETVDDAALALKLRHRILKLRWIGCEAEEAAVTQRLKRQHLISRGFSPDVPETD